VNAHDFALIAQEAYIAAPDIGQADSASRAIVRETPAGLVIAFPGTDNGECVIADLDAIPEPVAGAGDLHRGFWQAWAAISVDVLAAISGRPVTLVGHSLGAALAIMAAVEMTVSDNPPAAVYGFEPPRVSPSLAIRALLAKVPMWLYRNGNDLVPELPPGWRHAGVLEQIGTASLPFPNTRDHQLARVIDALQNATLPNTAMQL
jgi:pimeloyl-ACP methyl ester carboxylesterase